MKHAVPANSCETCGTKPGILVLSAHNDKPHGADPETWVWGMTLSKAIDLACPACNHAFVNAMLHVPDNFKVRE